MKWKTEQEAEQIWIEHTMLNAALVCSGTRARPMAAYTQQLRCRSPNGASAHTPFTFYLQWDAQTWSPMHRQRPILAEIKRQIRNRKKSAATSGTNKIESAALQNSLDGMRRAFRLCWCFVLRTTTTTYSLKSEQMPAAAFYANCSKCKTPNQSEGNQLTFASRAHKFISSLFRRARATIYLDFTILRNNRLSSAVVCFNFKSHKRHVRRQMTE